MLDVTEKQVLLSARQSALAEIDALDHRLSQYFRDRFVLQTSLSRSLVSFQANKTRAIYRWYKFKEAFSASLVEYLLAKYGVSTGKVLDPFAGSGTTLFVASAMGLDAEGIELLPIGHQIIAARECLEKEFTTDDFAVLKRWAINRPWEKSGAREPLPQVRITQGAYPPQTLEAIERYMAAWRQENDRVKTVLQFVLFCVLESVSYTRKDGQYLRWDYRSGRQQGAKPFDKGPILDFGKAICAKLDEILVDLQIGDSRSGLFPVERRNGSVRLYKGSCLEVMPTLPGYLYDAVLTSPPYCNRYDYTRTYALELALLGLGESDFVNLRQKMLSCAQWKIVLRICSSSTRPGKKR